MLHITNKKVAGFNARWAPFHGFSILFNNPGDHCLQQRDSDISDLVNNVRSDPALHFYKTLEEGVTHLDINALTNRFLFCALPSNAYHVTLWDGLNYRHITQIDPQYRSMAENWLSSLPKSFCVTPKDISQLPMMSSLCTKCDWNMNFRFDRLAIWNNSVLAVALRPDANSVSTFEQLLKERQQLNKQFHDRFNVITASETYIPHVSLGYFANEEGAQKALDFVDDWNKWFNDALHDRILSFNNASIYGLTDMVSFFKENDK
jgi:hypothetical protein